MSHAKRFKDKVVMPGSIFCRPRVNLAGIIILLLIGAFASGARAFVDNGDGSVSDLINGLIWQQADDGVGRTWDEALDYCEGLNYAGHDNWRLPNIRELKSIVDNSRYDPAIDPVFQCRSSYYWSGSTYANNQVYAWLVGFYTGYVYYYSKTNDYYVRCVRTGPCGLFGDLVIKKSGIGSGKVTSSPAGIDCGNDCNETYQTVTNVTLTAKEDSGSVFKGWSGGGCSGSGACKARGEKVTTVTAAFAKVEPLNIKKSGAGSGKVTSSPAGIDCGNDCTETYPTGTDVTLIAKEDSGSVFKGWSGGGCSGLGTCVVRTGDKLTVTAAFAEIAPLNIKKSGVGSGKVTSSPAGIDCGDDCTETYSTVTDVTLTAAEDSGSVFKGWSGGGCSGLGACVVKTGDKAVTVTAAFAEIAPLNIKKSGVGSGKVTSSPAGIDCGSDCTETYPTVTDVTLTAKEDSGSVFKGWSGGGCSGLEACVVRTGDKAVTVTAAFAEVEPLNVTPKSLPPGEKGVAYTAQIEVTGGCRPYVFSIKPGSGSLPPGLKLDPASGQISGAPTQTGCYTFSVIVTDKCWGLPAEGEFTICVTEELRIATPSPLPQGTTGVGYFQSLQAVGGTAPYSFKMSKGSSLPSGLSLNPKGNITGVPRDRGAYNFTVLVKDGTGFEASKTFDLQVADPVVIRTTGLSDGLVGQAYSKTFEASGGYGAYHWQIYSGTSPEGLTLNASTGVLSGTPVKANVGAIVISVTDDANRTAYKDFTLRVADVLKIVTQALPDGFKGEPYAEFIRVSGGIEPFSFSSKGLPDGLTLNKKKGFISGTPGHAGLVNVSVTVEDSTSPTHQKVKQNLSIRISSQLTIVSSAVLPNAQKGAEISPIMLSAKGGASPYRWTQVGGYLPEGVKLDPATGVLSGAPLDKGDFVFDVQVSDSAKNKAQKQFIEHISDVLAIGTGAVPDGAVGVAYSCTLSAAQGSPPYTWRFKTGTLPNGLSFKAATATIMGTPTKSQSVSFTIEVNDSDSPAQKKEQVYMMEVMDKLFIYTKDVPNGRADEPYRATVEARLGKLPYTWSRESGVLPTGVTLKNSGGLAVLEGTPTEAGSYRFSLQVSDASSPTQKVTREYVAQIYGNVAVTTTVLSCAYRGVAYSDYIVATGGRLPYTWSIVEGSLPTGLSLNSTSGHISGTTNLTKGHSSTFKVRVTDSGSPGSSVEKEYVIYVVDPLKITTTTIQKAKQGSAYKASLQCEGGIPPYRWSIENGKLPNGLTLDPDTGVISGSPTECGAFQFTVKVKDSAPVPNTASRAFSLEVICGS